MKRLGMFAKYWEPGQVKTRLAATIGNAAAAQIHHAFVTCLTKRLRDLGDKRTLAYSPAHRQAGFHDVAGECWQLVPQSSGDLGNRMATFFQEALEDAEQVVLIGSDSPTISRDRIDQAFDALQQQDVVLGPSDDGGYYLIGLNRPVPAIFVDVDWGTPQVWDQTTAHLKREQIAFTELPAGYDVDDFADFRRLHAELKELSAREDQDADLLELLKTIGPHLG